jgi:Lon protease-like protein
MVEERGREKRELRDLVAQAAGALKVFPLPGVVVFPGTPTPFHIFEPRYRELIGDALEGDRTLCVATLEDAGDGSLGEHAPVHPVAGAGVIEADERLPDGRYHILFRCLARVRLVTELESGRAYREFSGELLQDRYPRSGPSALAPDVEALAHLAYDLCRLLPGDSGAQELAEAVAHMRSPARIADLLAAAVVNDTQKRIEILETLDVQRRMGLVAAELASVLLTLSKGKTPSA